MTTLSIHRRSLRKIALLTGLSIFAGRTLQAQPAPEASPAELKHVAVVAATNYDSLISDVNFIGSLVGKPNVAATIEGTVAGMTGGKGLAGVDKTKPWGLIVQTDGMQFLPVICLPVTSADELLGAVAAIGADIKDEAGGMKKLTLPDQSSIFVKTEGGWSFLARDAASLARVPKDPQAAFSRLLGDYDFAARAAAQNVPPMYRQLAILTIQSAMQQQLQRQPNETDEGYAERRKSVQAQMQQAIQQIQDIDMLTFAWLVDQPQKRSVMDFTYSFVPDSKLAKQMNAYGPSTTNYAGFYQPDAAATVRLVSHVDPQEMDQQQMAQFETMIDGARAQFNKAIDESDDIPDQASRDALKAAGSDWFDAFAATIKAGVMDSAASLRVSPESLTFVAGATIQEPSKIESGLKKLEAGYTQSPQTPKIQWNAAAHDGVNFHTLNVPLPNQQSDAAKLLGGQAELALGIGPNAVYLAAGKDNLASVQKAIDASKGEPNKKVLPFELSVTLLPILETIAAQGGGGSDKAQAVVDMLRQQAAGRDHVRVSGEVVPNGLKYRLEAEEGALRAIGAAAATAGQQAAVQ